MDGLVERMITVPDEEIEAEYAELRRRRAEITARLELLDAVRRLQARLRGESPPLRAPAFGPRGSKPREGEPFTMREAILALLGEEESGTLWRANSIIGHLRERGWLDDRKPGSILAALTRLVESGEVERPSKGVYRLPMGSHKNEGEGPSGS